MDLLVILYYNSKAVVMESLFIVPACTRTDAIQTNASVCKPDVTTEGEWNLTERHGAYT